MQLKIEKLVYGGAGLARTEHGVVFVPRTAPGDVVEVELTERKADYSLARVESIVEPSADRQTPSCPNYDTVGCCHWQHIRYPRQLEIKQEILRETLHRAGRIEWREPFPVISGPDRGYRLRAAFLVRDRLAFFIRQGSKQAVAVRECSALAAELNDRIPEINTLLAAPEMETATEVRAVAAPGGAAAAAFALRNGQTRLHAFGPQLPQVEVDGFVFELHPEAFFQSNHFLLRPFLQEVLDQAGEEPGHVLDLFCGSGFFSIPMARRAVEVLGVESNPMAVRQGKAHARRNDVRNARFFHDAVETSLQGSSVKPTVILLNPPRTGCGKKTAERIAALGARRIVYVSCNPSTFAREAAVFLRSGYRLSQITLIDQFPDTYHIETVARFDA